MGVSNGPSHIASLDGIRAVSIALVIVAHCGFGNFVPGGFGVTIFFFLSGYLITTLLAREWDAHGQIAFGAFFMRRVLRLGPALVVTLACAMALLRMGQVGGELDPKTLLSQLLFFWNYYAIHVDGSGTIQGLGILWSLSVEEHFYLLWPVMFVLIARRVIGLRSIGVLLFAILAWRSCRYFVLGDGAWVVYISTDTRFDSLLYGCFLALMQWRGAAERVFPQHLMWIWVVVGLLLLLCSLLFRDPDFRATLRYSVQGVGLMPLFYYAITRPEVWLFRPLNWNVLRRVGEWSYGMYLAHLVIIFALVQGGVAQFGAGRLILIAGALSVGYAAFVHIVFERPLKPLRLRLAGHSARTT